MLHINRTDTNHMVNRNKETSCQRIYFSICNACFWCASCIDVEKMAALNTKCPDCHNPRLELTRITSDSICEL
jgi:Zn finger protein HypA/HybF involved in hydrogenase expression